jgi:diguanylate cyclase (GGDEF)-like protein
MVLDIRTIMLLMAVSSFIMGLSIFITSHFYAGHIRGMERWAYACGAQGCGWLLSACRDYIPDFFAITLSNTLVILSVALYYQALRERKGIKSVDYRPFGLVFLVFLGFIYFTHISPQTTLRLVIVSLGGAVLSFLCTRTILKDSTEALSFSYWLTAVTFGLVGVLSIIRAAAVVLSEPTNYVPFGQSPTQNVTYLLSYIMVTTVTCGFLLMCSVKFHAELQHLATRDSLTGILNRGTIELLIQKEFSRARRTTSELSILMLDLDHFKLINDEHGHIVGDDVLRGFIREVSPSLRFGDLIGRYGGEEFIVVLPNTGVDEAVSVAERVRQKVEQTCLTEEQESLLCTTSVGLAVLQEDDLDHVALLHRADQALYRAKREGRNRINIAGIQ